MTGRINCSRAVYMRFWNEKYHATPEDGARFDEFGRILDELESNVKPGRPLPFLPNDFSYFPALQVRERVLATAFGSKSVAEFRNRMGAFATASQAAGLAGVLKHFQQRLHPWWGTTGRQILAGRSRAVERRLRDLGVPGMAAEVATFLETRPDERGYYLHAVPSPEYEGTAAAAPLFPNHFCGEVTHQFVLDDFAWVVAHELTHSLYGQAPQARKDALMRQFVESGDKSAQPLYMYLNEAMATGVGLLLVERNRKSLKEPYRDAYIPRLGEATLPLLRSALANQKTLYDGFASPYLAAARAALGEEADGLQLDRKSVV